MNGQEERERETEHEPGETTSPSVRVDEEEVVRTSSVRVANKLSEVTKRGDVELSVAGTDDRLYPLI
jgi:hypothetical protein